jgi:hypothetical protein
MTPIYGLPQLPLTGAETVTIHQTQNGQPALCTMPLSELAALLGSGGGNPTVAWATGLPTAPTPGTKTLWLNNGVLSFS